MNLLPLQAEEARIAEEVVAPQPIVIPLREAVGERQLREALDSGRYTYAGNAKCRLCHRDFFLGRKQDVHDHAFEKLIGTEYENNSRCLACHTTGHGVKGGFTSIEQTPRLMNVQCEGCHGPGSEHIRRNAKGGFLAGTDRPEILQKMCLSCHSGRWNRAFTDFHTAYDSYKSAKPGDPDAAPLTTAK
ncbi:MAG TPA: cytochrome c family protein [Gammaproteobacteria bacterium]